MILPSPVRKIGPTRRSVSGYHAFRGEESIAFESTLERDFLVRADFDLEVLGVISQPCEIPYQHPATGRRYTYTPDYLVYYRLGDRDFEDYPKPLLVEVKPQAMWREHWREWLPKWKAALHHAKREGWTFRIHDESRIRDRAFDNITFLARYKRMTFPPEESRNVLNTVREMGVTTLDYLLARHFMGIYRAEGISHLWHLLATRRLDCDVALSFSPFTEVWVPDHE
ncbi:MAG: TnsA endonuclease N-terminal domain-containing protein [Halomonas sp.]|uniref:heteromeric transposase endonuclease subunit TnsA n=1 Tax=Halomonas sp. TaxID=1486246 RepID=UPI00183C48D1|nr:heteromeric transposase endonuclease subunit TnsA [Halomonas sp.]NWN84123.1 TnsA endonuclease N-terminal domain-containing protein [Halomonas sp.]